MIQKVYHVVPAARMSNGWDIKAGRSTIVGHADTKEGAIDAAIRAAKQHLPAMVKVSTREGTCEAEMTFDAQGGNSPVLASAGS